jgi:hypothetical protein
MYHLLFFRPQCYIEDVSPLRWSIPKNATKNAKKETHEPFPHIFLSLYARYDAKLMWPKTSFEYIFNQQRDAYDVGGSVAPALSNMRSIPSKRTRSCDSASAELQRGALHNRRVITLFLWPYLVGVPKWR